MVYPCCPQDNIWVRSLKTRAGKVRLAKETVDRRYVRPGRELIRKMSVQISRAFIDRATG